MRCALVLAVFLLTPSMVSAERHCTMLVDADSGDVLVRDGTLCDERTSPASTFKVALSVMGYDTGILTDAHHPEWPYKDEYQTWNESWKHVTEPTAWLKESVVWYSQVLTRILGMERFQRYVDGFEYGNRNLKGDPGRNNGLTFAWLSSSLQVSPVEQAAFMRALLAKKLPVAASAVDQTVAIMPSFELSNGWTAYGKTGTGYQFDRSGKTDLTRQFGWFVGWAMRGGHTAIFVRLSKDDRAIESSAGLRARDEMLALLPPTLSSVARYQ